MPAMSTRSILPLMLVFACGSHTSPPPASPPPPPSSVATGTPPPPSCSATEQATIDREAADIEAQLVKVAPTVLVPSRTTAYSSAGQAQPIMLDATADAFVLVCATSPQVTLDVASDAKQVREPAWLAKLAADHVGCVRVAAAFAPSSGSASYKVDGCFREILLYEPRPALVAAQRKHEEAEQLERATSEARLVCGEARTNACVKRGCFMDATAEQHCPGGKRTPAGDDDPLTTKPNESAPGSCTCECPPFKTKPSRRCPPMP